MSWLIEITALYTHINNLRFPQWCLHDPNQFLAVHSAFVYWGEQNMRRVDANVTASPYWDFHVRTGLGAVHTGTMTVQ